MQSGAQLGPAAGVFFAGLILQATRSPTYIFIVFGVVGLAGAAAWWLYAKDFSDPRPQGAQAETNEAKERRASTDAASAAHYEPGIVAVLHRLFCTALLPMIFLTWLPQYLTHYRNIPLVTASVLSALPFLVSFIGANFAGWAMDWLAEKGFTKGGFHRKFFVALGAATYAVTTLIAATTSSTAVAVTMIVIANAGLAFYVVPYWTICTDVAPNQTGTLGGIMNFFGIIGATASPYLSGVIAQETGAFVAPLLLAVAISDGGHDHDPAVPHQAVDKPRKRNARGREIRGLTLFAALHHIPRQSGHWSSYVEAVYRIDPASAGKK